MTGDILFVIFSFEAALVTHGAQSHEQGQVTYDAGAFRNYAPASVITHNEVGSVSLGWRPFETVDHQDTFVEM